MSKITHYLHYIALLAAQDIMGVLCRSVIDSKCDVALDLVQYNLIQVKIECVCACMYAQVGAPS